jgi:hypothetical protein
MIVDVVHAGWCIHFTFDADLEMKTFQSGWSLQEREWTALLKMSSNLTFKEEGDVYICWLHFRQQEDVRKMVKHRKRGANLITPHLTP